MAGRPKKEIADYVSVHIPTLRSILAVMPPGDKETWLLKAIEDCSLGCVTEDTDPRVKACYLRSKTAMDERAVAKQKYYEKKKAEKAEMATTSETIPLPAEQPKIPDNAQVYGSEQNVHLTPNQYNDLVGLAAQWNLRIDNVNKTIESLSCKLKDGTQKSDDHFATLKSWINFRGERMKEKEENRPKTFSEIENERFVKRGKELGLL